MNGEELHPGLSARIGEEPPTNASSRPKPEMAGNCTQHSQPGFAGGHSPIPPADPSKEWRGTAPRALSQDWSPPTTTSSRHQPRRAENCIHGLQPGLARDHPQTLAADPNKEWRGTASSVLSRDWGGAARTIGNGNHSRSGDTHESPTQAHTPKRQQKGPQMPH